MNIFFISRKKRRRLSYWLF